MLELCKQKTLFLDSFDSLVSWRMFKLSQSQRFEPANLVESLIEL